MGCPVTCITLPQGLYTAGTNAGTVHGSMNSRTWLDSCWRPRDAGACRREAALFFEFGVDSYTYDRGLIHLHGTHHIHAIFMARTTQLAWFTVSSHPLAAQASTAGGRPTTSEIWQCNARCGGRQCPLISCGHGACLRARGETRDPAFALLLHSTPYSAAHRPVTPSGYMIVCTSMSVR